MQRKKLAIVTSYGDLCGNAEYSDVLKKSLEKFYEISILPLNVDILRGMKRRYADLYVKEIASQLKEFDLVNIQFEAGLLGILPKDVFRRFRLLVKNSKKLIITMHRLDIKEPFLSRNDLQLVLKLKISKFCKNSINSLKNNQFAHLYKKVIQLAVKKNAGIVVHTMREKNRISVITQYKAKVFDHPISFLSQKEIEYYRNKRDKSNFLASFNLPGDAVTIGTFGFIADYKGINVLINSLKFLPENFHILMFGSQHPLKIKSEPKGDTTLLNYMDMFHKKENKLSQPKEGVRENNDFERKFSTPDMQMLKQFHFLGSFYNHDDFVKTMIECDLVIFPYQEVGQSGSGIVAVALDMGANIICSQNLSFLELVKYTGPAIRTFSIGNHLELAEKIKIAVKNGPVSSDAMRQYNLKYNLDSNAQFYADLF